jgi:hypothetical protein
MSFITPQSATAIDALLQAGEKHHGVAALLRALRFCFPPDQFDLLCAHVTDAEHKKAIEAAVNAGSILWARAGKPEAKPGRRFD